MPGLCYGGCSICLFVCMPNLQSAKKELRKTAKRRAANLVKKHQLRTAVKNIRRMVAGGETATAAKELPGVYKVIDKSAKFRLIKKNTASRLKSRIASAVNKKTGK